MNKDKIKEYWNSVGFTNASAYHQKVWNLDRETRNAISAVLDPDEIDIKEFWQATDEQFSTDTVANTDPKLNGNGQFSYKLGAIEQANKKNQCISNHLGMMGMLDLAIDNLSQTTKELSIVELGCGYGAFYYHGLPQCSAITSYTGIDVVKRFDADIIVPDNKNGTLSEEQVSSLENSADIIYSCNVIQHLSAKQLDTYLKDFKRIIKPCGYMCLMFGATFNESNPKAIHYGMETPLYTTNQIISMLLSHNICPIQYNLCLIGSIKPFAVLCEYNK